MPYEEYRKWYDQNDMVYIVLVDCKVYTKVHREVMFEKSMHHGCFIEHYSYDTPNQVEEKALAFAQRIGAVEVSNEEFISLEKEGENQRVAKAFAYAESLIAQG